MGSILLLWIALILLVTNSGFMTVNAEEEFVAVRGDSVHISVILLQNGTYGNPVPNQVIEFYDQSNDVALGINTTDVNGLAIINWAIPYDYALGPTIINATFRGNESLFLLPSNQFVIINILSSTEIILQDIPTVLAPGDSLSFSINLLDDTSNPLENRIVYAYSNDSLLATGITNSTGGAYFSIHCNSSWCSLGENLIRVVHEQDIDSFYQMTETTFTLEIEKLQTSISSNFSYTSVLLGDNLSFDLEITSSEGGISTDLEIKLDGNPLLLTTTNPSGWSSIQFDIDNQFTLGHHVLTILYNGSERYMDTFLVNEFDILSPMGIEIMVPSYPVIGTETSMVVSLYDTFTRPLEGTLTITDLSNGYNMSIQIPEDSIDINIAISFSGPVGLHNLLIEVNNQFVINPSRIQNITIWAQPVISLQNSNILHYASPRQEITFVLNLTNWSNKISFQSVHLLCNGNLLVSSTTNDEGIVSLSTLAPEDEGLYNLSVIYSMNLTRYELPAKLDYSLIVTLLMPVQVELDYYEVIPPLQKISIYLHAWCLNGSQVEGIPITISWQSSETSIVTDQDGLLIIDLTVPEYSGNYTLSYSLEQDHKLASTSGTISILITLTDVLTSQGIGINGFVFGFLAIFTIFAVPVIRQKYLIM